MFTKRNGKAFVDDKALWAVKLFEEIEAAVEALGYKSSNWARLLYVSGGWLNLKKCFWCAIRWRFKANGKAIICSINDMPHLEIALAQGTETIPTRLRESRQPKEDGRWE